LTVWQSAFFLPVDAGTCFCVCREPRAQPPVGVVLHLPAFGDEMNKSRVMTSRMSRALAQAGFVALQIDLLGCGDSSGEHSDASLTRWVHNAETALSWLRARHRECAVSLWALRAGALLVPPLIRNTKIASVLLWQPIVSGAQQLNL
jgi:exosortase A-associated hydrolase 2